MLLEARIAQLEKERAPTHVADNTQTPKNQASVVDYFQKNSPAKRRRKNEMKSTTINQMIKEEDKENWCLDPDSETKKVFHKDKQEDWPKIKEETKEWPKITSSQLDPTQYSSPQCSSPQCSSPLVVELKNNYFPSINMDNDRLIRDLEVDDSEDELSRIELPTPVTNSKQKDVSDELLLLNSQTPSAKKVDLTRNPIADREWILEDFQPNPRLNNNMDFAYQGTVRGANQQKKLFASHHAKLCRECEKIKAKTGPTANFNSGLLWGESKQRCNHQIVNIWQRPPSPPGFSRSEFPTTQEQRDDREKAKTLTRKKTISRLAEAIDVVCVDGKWEQCGTYIFRNKELNKSVISGKFDVNMSVFQ